MIGQTISHYKILEKLGEGGMGVVYKAEDVKLKRTIALKFLPHDLTSDPVVKERFMNEALAISKLNHPHIATIHDFVEADDREFIVLEYIEGGTLRQKIKKQQLSVEEVLEYAVQITEGLAYAHKKEIVHRDIKTDNVMLTGDGKAKITDFGLAKLKDTTKITKTGSTVGTAAYMSPEQVQNMDVDHRSDIFSLGVVLYEMTTGELPFKAAHEAALMYEIMHSAPKPITEIRADISPEFERVVEKAMAKDIAGRYQTADALLLDLQAIRKSMISGVKPVISIAPKRNLVIPALVIAGLIIVSLVWFFTTGKRGTKISSENGSNGLPLASKTPRKSVAVIGFKNLSDRPDEEWVSTALSEMLTTELSAGNKLRTIPGENISRMKIDLALKNEESFAKQTLDKIRDVLGADYVVMGSYLAAGGEGDKQLRIDLRIQDASAGETLASIAEVGTESKIFDLVAAVGLSLREKLGIGNIPSAETATLRASYPVNPEAVRLYSEGLVKLRTFDALRAKETFLQAIAADTTYALAHSALAEAWNQLGFELKAKDEAEGAFHLSGNLRQEEKLFVEGRYREYAKEWDRAIELYRNLWNLAPDNIDYGLRFANVLGEAGKAADGFKVIEQMEAMPANAKFKYLLSYHEANLAFDVSDYQREKDASQRAIALAGSQGARSIIAMSYIIQGWGLDGLSDFEHAITAFQNAQNIFSDIGNKNGLARAIDGAGIVYFDEGNYPKAQEHYQLALKYFQQIGSKSGEADGFHGLGYLFCQLGDFEKGKPMLETAINIQKEIGDKRGMSGSLNLLGNICANTGNPGLARDKYKEALALAREINNKELIMYPLGNLARIDQRIGKLDEAQKELQEALAIAGDIKDKLNTSWMLAMTGKTYFLAGDLKKGREVFDTSDSLAHEIGAKSKIAYNNLYRSESAIYEEKYSEVEQRSRAAIEYFASSKGIDGEEEGRALLTIALVKSGKLKEADAEIARALKLDKQNKDIESRSYVSIAQAQVAAAKKEYKKAFDILSGLIVDVTKMGYVNRQMETRLAWDEIELQAGKTDSARVHLQSLAAEARATGFEGVALKAEETLKKIGKN
ncbi:MAG: protein kinase [Bacteroidota bacterium]